MMDMKRIYYLQRIILSVLLLLPLSGCFDSDINRKMYEADDDEMQRENHIVGATLRGCKGLSARRASTFVPVYGCHGGRSIWWLYGRNCRHLGDEILHFQSRTGMAQISICRPYHRPLSPIPQDVERDG